MCFCLLPLQDHQTHTIRYLFVTFLFTLFRSLSVSYQFASGITSLTFKSDQLCSHKTNRRYPETGDGSLKLTASFDVTERRHWKLIPFEEVCNVYSDSELLHLSQGCPAPHVSIEETHWVVWFGCFMWGSGLRLKTVVYVQTFTGISCILQLLLRIALLDYIPIEGR